MIYRINDEKIVEIYIITNPLNVDKMKTKILYILQYRVVYSILHKYKIIIELYARSSDYCIPMVV